VTQEKNSRGRGGKGKWERQQIGNRSTAKARLRGEIHQKGRTPEITQKREGERREKKEKGGGQWKPW